jgi:hypothetical protein
MACKVNLNSSSAWRVCHLGLRCDDCILLCGRARVERLQEEKLRRTWSHNKSRNNNATSVIIWREKCENEQKRKY